MKKFNWVSVKKRMPKSDRTDIEGALRKYAVKVKGEPYWQAAFYINNSWRFIGWRSDNPEVPEITHWANLEEMPEEVEEETSMETLAYVATAIVGLSFVGIKLFDKYKERSLT